MPSYYVSAHFELLEPDVSDEEFKGRLADVKARLPDTYQTKAFGGPKDYVVTVVIEAEDEKAAQAVWHDVIDRAIDDAKLGHGSGRYATPLSFSEVSG